MPPMLLCPLIFTHSLQLAHHPLQGNSTCNWTALLYRAQPFFLLFRVCVDPWLHSRHGSYPAMPLWSQLCNCAWISSFCLFPMLHAYKSLEMDTSLWKGKFEPPASYLMLVSQALPNRTSCFHFSSEGNLFLAFQTAGNGGSRDKIKRDETLVCLLCSWSASQDQCSEWYP